MTCCTFPGCLNVWKAHGYCSGHYQQLLQGKPLKPLRKSVPRTEHTAPGEPSAYGYIHHGCRCPDCTTAHARRHKQWRLQHARTGPAMVDSTGTLRRLRALCWAGWSRAQIAAMVRMAKPNVQALIGGEGGLVHRRTEQAVRRAYDRYWKGPPAPTMAAEKSRITRARKAAELNGWAPPLAWDDDSIDNPEAKPYTTAAEPKRRGEVVSEVRQLLGSDSAQGIARRLGYRDLDSLAVVVGRRDKHLADRLRAQKEVA